MEPIVSIRHLDHYYGANALKKQVLFDINLDIVPGEIVIMTGPSGSGKTTLLTLLGGLRSVQSGQLKCLDSELAGASENQLVAVRRHIGYIFQAHNLLPFMTARQNVGMSLEMHSGISRRVAQSQSCEMLERVGLGEHIDYYPDKLSGGQKQRVAIARALVSQPKLVLADEPTASLDKQTGRDVVDLMYQLVKQQGCTILLVTHDNRILDVADRIIHMEDGRLVSATAQKASIPMPAKMTAPEQSFDTPSRLPSHTYKQNGATPQVRSEASNIKHTSPVPQAETLSIHSALIPGLDPVDFAAYSPQRLSAVGFTDQPVANSALVLFAPPPEPQPKVYKVVCIDTDTEFLSAVEELLDQDHFETIAIDNPVSALVTVLEHQPDLILMEVKLPGFDGYQLCNLLRQNPLLKKTPIIITTRQKRNVISRLRARMSGASGYLVKPLSQLQLMTTIFPHIF